jgi:hypothetical protein
MSEEIARFSKEQTAAFLAGGELGRPEYTNPETARRMELQRKQLRVGWNAALDAMYQSLKEESPQSASRLLELKRAAFAGDTDAMRLLTSMLGELLKQGLAP